MLAELREVLIRESIDYLPIVIFGSPDPDALASAFGLTYILKHFEIKTKIFCEKDISFPNNQMMVNQLDIPLFRLSEAKDLKFYAIVDYQFQEITGAQCVLHFDHHKEIPSNSIYKNIDPSAGSTSTLIAAYLKDLEHKDAKLMPKIALGLAYGLYTDTRDLFQANAKDLEALAYLRNYYDCDALTQLVQVKYSTQTMEVIKKALEHNQVKGTFAYSGIGYLSAEYRDCLAIAADFLLSQAGISNVLVFGVVEGADHDSVNGCFRTSDSSMDVHKFMQTFVVHGSGGGRKNAGGFQEPLGFFEDCKPKEKVWDLVKMVVEEKIKTKLNLTMEGSNG